MQCKAMPSYAVFFLLNKLNALKTLDVAAVESASHSTAQHSDIAGNVPPFLPSSLTPFLTRLKAFI